MRTINYSQALPRTEQETVIVWTPDEVTAYTTNPSHWLSLKRRAKTLGGTIDLVHTLGPRAREVGGQVTLTPECWSSARFGLRASLGKAKA